MNRKATAALVIVALIATVSLRADAPATQKDLGKENAELKAKVESLQKQNAELKERVKLLQESARLKELEKANVDLGPRLWYVPTEPAQPKVVTPPKANAMPPGAVEREFNGVTYYVVPLGSTAETVNPKP